MNMIINWKNRIEAEFLSSPENKEKSYQDIAEFTNFCNNYINMKQVECQEFDLDKLISIVTATIGIIFTIYQAIKP